MRFAGQAPQLLHRAQALVQAGEVQLGVPRGKAPPRYRKRLEKTPGKNVGKLERMAENERKVSKTHGRMEEHVGKMLEIVEDICKNVGQNLEKNVNKMSQNLGKMWQIDRWNVKFNRPSRWF